MPLPAGLSQFHGKARRFFAKRQKFLLVLGWLIIVATFIVKDVFRDQLKNVADSVNAAESQYLITEAYLDLHQEIDEVDANLAQTKIDLMKVLPPVSNKEREKYQWSTAFDRNSTQVVRIIDETGLEVDSLSQLVSVAPPKPEHLAQFDDLSKQCAKD